VIAELGGGTRRFTELKREIDGISQRMLTVTLRGLERDGIVTRTVYPVMPPRVDYTLTTMGNTLLDAVSSIIAWATSHVDAIAVAHAAYDARVAKEQLAESVPRPEPTRTGETNGAAS
jgi:DNA-binding HxlR family transcriptional regulator